MTVLDPFDPIAGRVSAALEEIAPATRPVYLDDVFTQTAGTRQRPRWSFPGRWLPGGFTDAVPSRFAGVPARSMAILLLLLLLVLAAAAVWVGRHPKLAPFGPAANGTIVYSQGGNLWTRDTIHGVDRLLYAAAGDQLSPSYSPDGRWLTFVTALADGDHFTVMAADATNVRELAVLPPSGNEQAAWRPDGLAIGLIYDVDSVPHLSIVSLDGSPTVDVDLGDLTPLELAWRPPDGGELLVRAAATDGSTDLYLMTDRGTELRALHLPIQLSSFGTWYTNSGAVWSPDGSTIAYNAVVPNVGREAEVFRVHLVDPDGSNDRELPGPAPDRIGRTVHENWPQYSPDGRWILVHRWSLNGQRDAKGWLAVMPSDGSAPATDIGPTIPGGNDTGLTKLWSPDGTRILMRTQNTTTAYSIDPFTGQWEPLDWTHELPDWQRSATN